MKDNNWEERFDALVTVKSTDCAPTRDKVKDFIATLLQEQREDTKNIITAEVLKTTDIKSGKAYVEKGDYNIHVALSNVMKKII